MCVQSDSLTCVRNDPGKVQHFACVLAWRLSVFPSTVSVSLSFSVCGLLTACRVERMVMLLSVGNILEQGNVTFSNTYKSWFINEQCL